MAAIAVAGSIFIGLYVHGLSFSNSTAAVLQGQGEFYEPANLLKVGDAFLTFLGLPWTRAAALGVVGRFLGAGLLVVGLFAILRRGIVGPRHGGGIGRLERISLGLIMFSLATAAVAAIGRVESESGGILPVRYSVLLVPLHIGIFCLALGWMKDRWAGQRGRRAMQAVALTLGALMLVQQVAAGEAGASKAQAMSTTIAEFMAGKRDPAMTRVVYGDLAYAQLVVDEMRRRQIYAGLDR